MLKQLFNSKRDSIHSKTLWIDMRDSFDDFLSLRSPETQRQYRGVVREFLAYLEIDSAQMPKAFPVIDKATTRKYFEHLRHKEGQKSRIPGVSSDATPETVKRKIIILRRIWQHWEEMGLIEGNPWVFPWPANKKPQARKRPTKLIPFELVKRILSAPGDTKEGVRDSAILAILFGAGLRRKECCNLRLGHIEKSAAGTVFVRIVAKGSFTCERALPGWAAVAVSNLLQQRKAEGASEHDFMFTRYIGMGQEPKGTQLSEKTLYRLFKRYCGEAGLNYKHFSPHSARATAITKLLADGADWNSVKDFAGHSSIKTTEIYDKRSKDLEQSAAKNLKY